MSLTSEMSRITTDFEATQGERLASIAKIRPGVTREKHLNRASLKRTMTTHRAATKNSLRDLFGMAALTRGAAVDLVERFGNEREESTSDLLDQLASFADDLREHFLRVGKQLGGFLADDGVGQDVGEAAMEFPGAEERAPIDELGDFIESDE